MRSLLLSCTLLVACGEVEYGVEFAGERLPVIDMHLHPGEWSNTPPSTQEFLAGRFPFPQQLTPEQVADGVLSPEGIASELDKAGIGTGVLFAVYAPRTVGIAANEDVLADVKTLPDRPRHPRPQRPPATHRRHPARRHLRADRAPQPAPAPTAIRPQRRRTRARRPRPPRATRPGAARPRRPADRPARRGPAHRRHRRLVRGPQGAPRVGISPAAADPRPAAPPAGLATLEHRRP